MVATTAIAGEAEEEVQVEGAFEASVPFNEPIFL
jgi:hypothetical protein